MSILYDETYRVFKLDTPHSTYAFHLTADGYLLHLYYGKYVPDIDLKCNLRIGLQDFVPATHDSNGCMSFDYADLELPTGAMGDYREPCFRVTDDKGLTECRLTYVSHNIMDGKKKLLGLPATYVNEPTEAVTIEILCRDDYHNLEVTLSYTAFTKLDVITRSVSVLNRAESTIRIDRILSTSLSFDNHSFDMITLNGAWARERHVERFPLHSGKQIVDSSRGVTSHQHNNFIALVGHDTTEDFGSAYGLALCYSGSFLAEVEVAENQKTRVVMGINPYDFSWELACGEEFVAPEVIMAYSSTGLSGMSHTLHDVIRQNLVRGKWKNMARPILINNWEATYFDFDTDKLISIAKEAANAGIEMLVMDDGWFGNRNDDTTSLGDWQVNTSKIKGGLSHLVDEVNKLGLRFGIWFEPEMISPKSELFALHPDWCLHVKGLKGTTARSQLVLDFSRQDVRDYVYDLIKGILSSANIEYVKWDMNRQLTEVGNEILPPSKQRQLWHRYVLGVYELQERLLSDFPELLLENCSGGGARFDCGMLYYSPQIWTSDDTDPIERLKIQYGTSLCYPCSTMGAHVSASPNHTTGRVTPFNTRGNVALSGTFGYELDVTKLTDEDKNAIKSQIAMFKQYNPLIRNGNYWRLGNPMTSDIYDAWQFVDKNQTEALLVYVSLRHVPCQSPTRICLKGLNEESMYKIDGKKGCRSGAFLMNNGIIMEASWGDFESTTMHFQRTEPLEEDRELLEARA